MLRKTICTNLHGAPRLAISSAVEVTGRRSFPVMSGDGKHAAIIALDFAATEKVSDQIKEELRDAWQ